MRKYILIFLVVGLTTCVSQKNTIQYEAISQKDFLQNPFGFKENIENFTQHANPKFTRKKLLRKNNHYPEKTDTIYQFNYKKSEIFFYKTHQGQEFLLAGKILNKQISLKNDIHVGLTKNEFSNRFSENISIISDSLQLKNEGTKYTFIFIKNKLYQISIDNYYD